MSHVPTPYQCSSRDWRNEQHEHNWYITGDQWVSETEGTLTTAVAIVPGNATSGTVARDTAEFLCRAANAHDRLRAACQHALRVVNTCIDGDVSPDCPRDLAMLTACRQELWNVLEAQASQTTSDQPLAAFWLAHAEWSQATFGADSTRGPLGPLRHLAKEVQECIAQPADIEEYADLQFLVFDATRRAGFSCEQLVEACFLKLAKNKARQWPTPTSDQPVEHVRDSGQCPACHGQGRRGGTVFPGDELLAECPDCRGTGRMETAAVAGLPAAAVRTTQPLAWRQVGNVWESTIGRPEADDGVTFILAHHLQCAIPGQWVLMTRVMGARWGSVAPFRHYHDRQRAEQEAQALADVLWANRVAAGAWEDGATSSAQDGGHA